MAFEGLFVTFSVAIPSTAREERTFPFVLGAVAYLVVARNFGSRWQQRGLRLAFI